MIDLKRISDSADRIMAQVATEAATLDDESADSLRAELAIRLARSSSSSQTWKDRMGVEFSTAPGVLGWKDPR